MHPSSVARAFRALLNLARHTTDRSPAAIAAQTFTNQLVLDDRGITRAMYHDDLATIHGHIAAGGAVERRYAFTAVHMNKPEALQTWLEAGAQIPASYSHMFARAAIDHNSPTLLGMVLDHARTTGQRMDQKELNNLLITTALRIPCDKNNQHKCASLLMQHGADSSSFFVEQARGLPIRSITDPGMRAILKGHPLPATSASVGRAGPSH